MRPGFPPWSGNWIPRTQLRCHRAQQEGGSPTPQLRPSTASWLNPHMFLKTNSKHLFSHSRVKLGLTEFAKCCGLDLGFSHVFPLPSLTSSTQGSQVLSISMPWHCPVDGISSTQLKFSDQHNIAFKHGGEENIATEAVAFWSYFERDFCSYSISHSIVKWRTLSGGFSGCSLSFEALYSGK